MTTLPSGRYRILLRTRPNQETGRQVAPPARQDLPVRQAVSASTPPNWPARPSPCSDIYQPFTHVYRPCLRRSSRLTVSRRMPPG